MKVEFISDYKNNEALRSSFNRLAASTFCISFEEYYQRGLWDDSYACYSYVSDGEIVANVSASRMEITRGGRKCNAIQLGTVMTAPEFRNKGLSAALIRRVLTEYENKCEFIYLFANRTVLDFYPKFGFRQCSEYNFTCVRKSQSEKKELRQLDLSDAGDYRLLSSLSQERIPVSQALGVKHHGVFMFNCLYGFPKDIYYSEMRAAAVIYKIEDDTLDIYDIISKKSISVSSIISLLPAAKTIRLHFTPENPEIYKSQLVAEPDTTLFVRPGNAFGSDKFVFPETSHA